MSSVAGPTKPDLTHSTFKAVAVLLLFFWAQMAIFVILLLAIQILNQEPIGTYLFDYQAFKWW